MCVDMTGRQYVNSLWIEHSRIPTPLSVNPSPVGDGDRYPGDALHLWQDERVGLLYRGPADRFPFGELPDCGLAALVYGSVFNWRNTNLLLDRKSTSMKSSHVAISYAVFCLVEY